MFTHASSEDKSTRERILAAAQKVLADSGVARLRVGAVAREAGVAQGAMYRHFTGRDDLIVAAILDSVGSVGALPDIPPDASARASLISLIDRVYQHEQRMGSVVVTVLADENLHRRFSEIMANAPGGPESFTGRLHKHLEHLRDTGHVRADIEPATAAATIQARCFHHAIIDALRRPTPDAEARRHLIETLADEILPAH